MLGLIPTFGLCHGGGTHDTTGSKDYRLVFVSGAPGDEAQRCVPCGLAVFDITGACPISLVGAISTPHTIDPLVKYRIA
jgi:hypothetical protein